MIWFGRVVFTSLASVELSVLVSARVARPWYGTRCWACLRSCSARGRLARSPTLPILLLSYCGDLFFTAPSPRALSTDLRLSTLSPWKTEEPLSLLSSSAFPLRCPLRLTIASRASLGVSGEIPMNSNTLYAGVFTSFSAFMFGDIYPRKLRRHNLSSRSGSGRESRLHQKRFSRERFSWSGFLPNPAVPPFSVSGEVSPTYNLIISAIRALSHATSGKWYSWNWLMSSASVRLANCGAHGYLGFLLLLRFLSSPMDSFTTQKTKSRKMKKLAKKSRVQIILDLIFQAIEIIVVLVTVAKLCYQLVITFEDSGVAAVIFANRNLAFVVGNTIVIALITKSGLLLNQELDQKCKSKDLYEEFVRESSRRDGISRADMRNREKQSGEEKNKTKQNEAEKETQSIAENIAKQSISDQAGRQIVIEKKKKKQSIHEKREKQSKPEKFTKQSTSVKREKQSIVEHHEITVKNMEKQDLAEKRESQSYQRSRSENLEGLEKSSFGRLRRSETDASFERFDSDDELRYKIESFIARQRRNQNDD